jgi:serine phosphatase RsbU (regulator of sigma subunit)
MERLVELLQRESSTAKKKVDLIKAALIEHNGDAAPYDDITILAVKRE